MEMGKEGKKSGEWHVVPVWFFPPRSYHRSAVGNGVLPSAELRKGTESARKPQRLRPAPPSPQNSVGAGGMVEVQPFSLSLRAPCRGQATAEVMETADALCLSRFRAQRLLLNNQP